MKKIAVIGSGSWGCALAIHAANLGNEVKIWSFSEEEAEIINKEKFKITIDRTDVSNILKLLENNSIKVYEIKKEDISLEKAFLEKTRGNIID